MQRLVHVADEVDHVHERFGALLLGWCASSRSASCFLMAVVTQPAAGQSASRWRSPACRAGCR
jgi:hypothetical protein